MEVSNQESSGENLVRTVITLSGLPEASAEQELGHVLKNAGENPANVTLEGLRAAMLAYLESMQAEFEAESQALTDDKSPL